jgi:hypothetical protein
MAKKHLIIDKTELIATLLMGNQWRNVAVTADKIRRIQYDKCVEKSLFKKVESEKITIEASASPPIVFFKSKEKEFFEEYKQDLEKFAKNNRLTFVDNIAGEAVKAD